ncbi:leucine-rich repeat domain-containing protein [Chaetoceros tenuissimus]|uniref:Leucine-rich repeat domain-containing protein n=1 Tax=Chaetoceros tenuissimus TaxID=426638 RepID=A0AAD3HC74_9STRA|nr:leucine-rich repeat domain-containing protein [Chaetoceros tenuissimus]
MKRSRNLTRAEWDAIVEEGPGMRMWKGKMTLFYNGEKLFDDENREYLMYSKEQRESWEVMIVLPRVKVIPGFTFSYCKNVKTVIMSDSVKRIEGAVFSSCESLEYVRLSRNLERIGIMAFSFCKSLTSIFIPPSCRQITSAFCGCTKLIILSVPQHTELGENVIAATALIEASPFRTESLGNYKNQEEVNAWIKNILQGDEFALHRKCSAVNPPLENDLVAILKEQGLPGRDTWRKPNSIGVTPLEYLEANPYVEIDEEKILKKFILEMMGEVV